MIAEDGLSYTEVLPKYSRSNFNMNVVNYACSLHLHFNFSYSIHRSLHASLLLLRFCYRCTKIDDKRGHTP